MIASLRGKVIYTDPAFAVIECGGVGFKCFVTKNTLAFLQGKEGEVVVYTHLAVREDALDLYGFSSVDELEAFKMITSVNGVGAKIGLALLSEFEPSKLSIYIASSDAKMLTRAAGVGIKLAQRIVLELKDKVGGLSSADLDSINAVGNATVNSESSEAVAALVSLGYSQSEASLAVGKLDQSLSAEQMIKAALKTLARGI
ncbi:MAG: Holliday junction branch migration protein RuvA [Clostridia bacterium]|nr:Holliday junction branch migration protein RuvA [Clostridia bacterium]